MNTKNCKWWWLFWVRKYKTKTRPKNSKRNIKKSYISYNTISTTSWNPWIQQISAIHVPYVSKNPSIPLWTLADTRDVLSVSRDSKNSMERCIKPIALCVGTRWIRFTNCIFASLQLTASVSDSLPNDRSYICLRPYQGSLVYGAHRSNRRHLRRQRS